MKFEQLSAADKDEAFVRDESMNPEKALRQEEFRVLFESRISRLTGEKQQEVARGLFLEGKTESELAGELKITRSRVNDIKKRVLRMISRTPSELKSYIPPKIN